MGHLPRQVGHLPRLSVSSTPGWWVIYPGQVGHLPHLFAVQRIQVLTGAAGLGFGNGIRFICLQPRGGHCTGPFSWVCRVLIATEPDTYMPPNAGHGFASGGIVVVPLRDPA